MATALKKKFALVTSKVVVWNSPVSGILAEAKQVNADLIVLGSRGHSKFERKLLGSVAPGIVARAPLPVENIRKTVIE